ncbi:MAG: TonB C-terminal domain-containing protein [Candidatus Obscuribacterales bacterium]|nr:TonB C-terminal domain-containing protein [Candidatus Obscuribacterales bacterium]
MVQARGGVKIKLREIPLYGVVVVDPWGQLPADAGIEPFLLSINGQSIENQTLPQLRTLLCGQPGTPVTLDILSADLNFHQFVTLMRNEIENRPADDKIWFTLEKSFDALDSTDSNDWPGSTLDLVERPSNTLLEPLSSALYNISIQLAQNWLNRNSFVHLFTQISAANYFDRVYKIKDADLAVESALKYLPDFDSLDFDESSHLFDFADHLIETGRHTQAKLLLNKLLEAAKNSVDGDTKTILCLRRLIALSDTNFDCMLSAIFERSQLSLTQDDLHLIGNAYLRQGDYKNAIISYSCVIARHKSPKSQNTVLRDFSQPCVYSKYKQVVVYEAAREDNFAQHALKEAIEIFHHNHSAEEIALIDQIPGFFPKPKDLAAKLAGLEVTAPDSAASDVLLPFYLRARHAFDALSMQPEMHTDEVIEDLHSIAVTEENVNNCETLIWTGLLNLARRLIEEKRFEPAQTLLNRIAKQAKDADFAPLYLVACFTEQAILADALGLNSDHYWSNLQALLLNYFVANQLWEHELKSLQVDFEEKEKTELRQQTIRAKVLRFWSLVYLRNDDCERAEKILKRALSCAESAAQIVSSPGLSELISLIHGDLAVAQIARSRLVDAEISVDKMFESTTSFFHKIYQITEAYKKGGYFEFASELLSRSIKLPERKSVFCRRKNFSEGGFHIWKLATLNREHNNFLEQAVGQFSKHSLPPLLACMAGDYAASLYQFEVAQNYFQEAAHWPKKNSTSVSIIHLKRTILLKAVSAAEQNTKLTYSAECDLVTDLANVSQTTNRLCAVVNYRRALAILYASSREPTRLLDRLSKLTAGKTQVEQFAEERMLGAQANKNFEVRTEHYWIDVATDHFRRNRLTQTIECVAHALEIYKLSAKRASNFQPLFICQQDSLPELLRIKGFIEDAESYMLEAMKATSIKYGAGSEQEALCMAELAHFYHNSNALDKTMSLISLILSAYITSLRASGRDEGSKSSALIHRLHQLALQITAGGAIDKAIELLEAIQKEEQKVLPPEHLDVIGTTLLLGRFRRENNQTEVSEVIFEHVFQTPLRRDIFPLLVRFAPDYCDVLRKLGKADAAQKITYLFSKAADEALAEQDSTKYVSQSSGGTWQVPWSNNRGTDDWEKIGRTKQAQDRYIKSVELVREHHSDQDLATEALNTLAASFVERNCLGQAAEIYLQLADRLKSKGPDYSFRRVHCFLSLARCYTRLCMYEEVPDLILQAKQANPEIHQNIHTLHTTLNYVDIEVEAHLFDSAREDLQTAESIIDEQSAHDDSQKREYLERIWQLWLSIGDQQSAAVTKAKLDQIPLPEIAAETTEEVKEETQTPVVKEVEKPVSKEPLPFAFLECVGHNFINFEPSVLDNPAYIYLKNLADKISQNWFPPVEKKPTHLQIQFSITRDGDWKSIKMLRPSNNKYANIAAEEAIQTSAPFDPLPEEFGEQALLQLTFNDAKYPLDKFGITFESVE